MQDTFRSIWRWFLPLFMIVVIALSFIPGQHKWLGFNLAMISMIVGGGIIAYQSLFAVLHTRQITAGVLVVITIVGCAYLGFYQAASLVALMMFIGEFLEDITLLRTRRAVQSLMDYVPEQATVLRNEEWVTVGLEEVQVGDTVLVRAGERIPVDGQVIAGEGAVNQAALTGESLPIDKVAGDEALMGTVNEFGSLQIKADKIGSGTVMGKVIGIVFEAQESKGRTQKIADRFATYFTPLIIVIAAGAWFLTEDIVRTMTVLVIACPCALVLATPTAAVASIGNLAKRGVLVKGGKTIETLSEVDAVCIDKTGTITMGTPKVMDFKLFHDMEHTADVLQRAAALEQHSEHPLARAIVEYAAQQGYDRLAEVESFQALAGTGVYAEVSGEKIWIGNERLVSQLEFLQKSDLTQAQQFVKNEESKGRTVLLIVIGERCVGGISIADAVRPEAASALAELREKGIARIVMLTGDNEAAAHSIAKEAGITEVRAGLLPAEKLDFIRELQAKGHTVAMVGDGVNDSPALMLADVGIAMAGRGTDIAIESSAVALMGDQLNLLPDVFRLSQRAMYIIKQNIWGFAVALNVIGITLAISGIINPVVGALIHNLGSLFVVGNSARLLSFRKPQTNLTAHKEWAQA